MKTLGRFQARDGVVGGGDFIRARRELRQKGDVAKRSARRARKRTYRDFVLLHARAQQSLERGAPFLFTDDEV